jgi:hypothetical protein
MVIEITTGGQQADSTPSSVAQEHLAAGNHSGQSTTIGLDTEAQQGSSRDTGTFLRIFKDVLPYVFDWVQHLKIIYFFQFLWVIFALQDADPDT